MESAWDERKNRVNKRKHGISFETASLVFDDPYHLTRQDREVNGEPRWQTIGIVNGVHLLLVAHAVTWQRQKSALSRHERQLVANGACMREATKDRKVKRASLGQTLAGENQKKELAALAALPDDQIDTSDIPELPPGAWKDAVRGRFYRVRVDQPISMRLDADVVAWLKKRGKGYQTRVNSILRQTMLTDIKRT